MIQCTGRKVDDIGVKESMKRINGGIIGIMDLKKRYGTYHTTLLKYEDFRHNFDYIYDHIETFFNLKISTEIKDFCSREYNIVRVGEIADQLGSYINYDDGYWHGKHISKYNGECYYYDDFFTQEQISTILADHPAIKNFIQVMGYN
jgi:hypothetical protein